MIRLLRSAMSDRAQQLLGRANDDGREHLIQQPDDHGYQHGHREADDAPVDEARHAVRAEAAVERASGK